MFYKHFSILLALLLLAGCVSQPQETTTSESVGTLPTTTLPVVETTIQQCGATPPTISFTPPAQQIASVGRAQFVITVTNNAPPCFYKGVSKSSLFELSSPRVLLNGEKQPGWSEELGQNEVVVESGKSANVTLLVAPAVDAKSGNYSVAFDVSSIEQKYASSISQDVLSLMSLSDLEAQYAPLNMSILTKGISATVLYYLYTDFLVLYSPTNAPFQVDYYGDKHATPAIYVPLKTVGGYFNDTYNPNGTIQFYAVVAGNIYFNYNGRFVRTQSTFPISFNYGTGNATLNIDIISPGSNPNATVMLEDGNGNLTLDYNSGYNFTAISYVTGNSNQSLYAGSVTPHGTRVTSFTPLNLDLLYSKH